MIQQLHSWVFTLEKLKPMFMQKSTHECTDLIYTAI